MGLRAKIALRLQARKPRPVEAETPTEYKPL
jgi:hypothetical protein